MSPLIFHILNTTAFAIGVIGISIIVLGCLRGLWSYLLHIIHHEYFLHIRYDMGAHLILGLDFLVGKDIIDTMLLDVQNSEQFWMDLVSLAVIVIIRVVLTYFIHQEMKDLSIEKHGRAKHKMCRESLKKGRR